jgi:ATP-dependent helicase HrpB
MLRAAGGDRAMARACALLSERQVPPSRAATSTTSDLLSALDRWESQPAHVGRVARELQQTYEAVVGVMHAASDQEMTETAFRRAVLAGYPDRVAQRREPGSPRVKLATGTGAVLGTESGVRDAEFLIAVDVRATPAEARIGMASAVERDWLQPNGIEIVQTFDFAAGVVRAVEQERYDALIVRERPAAPDPQEAARLLSDAWLARGDDVQLLRRIRFAGHQIDLNASVRAAAEGRRSLAAVELTNGIPAEILRTLDARAPVTLKLPSGRSTRLQYLEDGRVKASVKLQDAFGLLATPLIGPRREPVLFELLAPNGRPVQLTTDLKSFWERTYPEVRKELRGRYPKHRWPEEPF